MATVVKRKLSESVDGKTVLIAATSSPGTSIHTAVDGQVDGSYDEVWLWAQNNHTDNVVLTIEFGGVDAKDNIIVTIPFKSGLVPVLPGLPLQNELVVKAFAATTNVISIIGFVNRITD
jgi:hypothetical protein